MHILRCARCRNPINEAWGEVFDKKKWYHKICYKTQLCEKIEHLLPKGLHDEISEKQDRELQDLQKILASL